LDEALRLVGVIEKQLIGKKYITGDQYTLADMMMWPWFNSVLSTESKLKSEMGSNPNIDRWFSSIVGRAAVKKALTITPFN